MTRTLLAAAALAATAASAAADEPLAFPIIPNVGGVVPMPAAADPPRKGAKLVIDVTAEAPANEVNKGLKRAALVLNLYGAAGLTAADVTVAVVFHGKATSAVLTDRAFADRYKVDTNPNLPVVRDLRAAGVAVHVCGQALNYSGFRPADVADGIPTALAAVLVVVNRQADGYAYVPVH